MSAPTALVVGEALIDEVLAGDGEVTSRPGGSPANVAVGLARLGVRTELLTTLGPDTQGAALRAHLTGAGVGLRVPAATPPARTSTARAVLDADGAAQYTFALDWNPGPFRPGPARLLHTGSLAMVLEPGASEVLEAFAAAEPGTLISADPNVRPSLGLPPELVRTRVESIARTSHLVKLSDEDLAWLYPDSSIAQACTRLHSLGVQLVVVTRGARGCTLSTTRWSSDLPALSASVVDTIGAGDAFMSGLLFAISSSAFATSFRSTDLTQDVCESWALAGSRCAAITVARAGARPPSLEELARFGEMHNDPAPPDRTTTTSGRPLRR